MLGAFKGDDKLLICTYQGTIKAVTPELSLHFDDNIYHIEKWNPKKPLTAIYFDIDKQRYFIKRFVIENSDKEDSFIKENGNLYILSLNGGLLLKSYSKNQEEKTT